MTILQGSDAAAVAGAGGPGVGRRPWRQSARADPGR
jgi:hydroxymethylbilane synthase